MLERFFSHKGLDSRAKEDVTKSEQVLGYFVGPCLVYMVYTGVAGTYLTQFYTDVLGLAGGFLTWMPLLSKLLSAFAGLLIGRVIDRTHTRQGKARPWIFFSGAMIALCGVLLYAVPRWSRAGQIGWVVVSYNLFFSLAFSTYALSHSLMVPLSTRNTKQRDGLAMSTSMATSMIPGMLSTIIMPLLVRRIGVGDGVQGSWLTVMGLLSAIAVPATLIEYFFTRERVSEEQKETAAVPFAKQVCACFHDKYWVMVMVFTLLVHLSSGMTTNSMLYYCNWVLADSVEAGAANQILVNVVGQGPMGFGILLLWPMVRKFGKRKVTIAGFCTASVGCLLILLAGDNRVGVLGGLLVKSFGSLPTYVLSAYLAETLDHMEAANGFRVDGFSASVNSIAQTVVAGLTQTLLLAGIDLLGYIPPASTALAVTQPTAVRIFFSVCFAGVPMLGYLTAAVIMVFYDLEKKNKQPSKKTGRRLS